VLTADLVHARRRGGELRLVGLDPDARAQALALAAQLVTVVRTHVGLSLDALHAALEAVDVPNDQVRLKDGLAKLLEDRCELTAPAGPEPEALRRDVFTRASAQRAALPPGGKLDRSAVLHAIAAERETTANVVERGLFADLRGAQLVSHFDAIGAEGLVTVYEHAQAQAVLLRAVKVRVHVQLASPAATRALFRRLKFLRLLHVITRESAGYQIEIDGPFSLFESVTKYGQKLAQLVPLLRECDAWNLEADVRWGKERRPLVFRLQGEAAAGHSHDPPLPDEIAALVKSFEALDTPWRVSQSHEILELPGVGLTVPDLVFDKSGNDGQVRRVHFEVMGYWSRQAVWKRVELVQSGLAQPVLFAVSSRLRVSEEVLGEGLPGALYVYKGALSARAIAERLDRLIA
jgi:predicted nuclease of restriction endonuclease-like RecB superfamily